MMNRPRHVSAIPGRIGLRVRLSASWAAAAILASAALAGCAGSTPSPTPATFSPGTSRSATSSPSTRAHTPTPRPTVTHTVTSSARPTHHAAPTIAPQTGGGGTAGFQDPLALALGAAAIVAGAGAIAYRRKVMRGQ